MTPTASLGLTLGAGLLSVLLGAGFVLASPPTSRVERPGEVRAADLPPDRSIQAGSLAMAVNRTARVADREDIVVEDVQEIVFRDNQWQGVDVPATRRLVIPAGQQLVVRKVEGDRALTEFSGVSERYSGWIPLSRLVRVRPPVRQGDDVVVTNDNVALAAGDNPATQYKRGQPLRVRQVLAPPGFGGEFIVEVEGDGRASRLLARDVRRVPPALAQQDWVEVTTDGTPLVDGDGVVALLPAGMRLRVRDLQIETQGGDWFLTTAPTKEGGAAGWVSIYNIRRIAP